MKNSNWDNCSAILIGKNASRTGKVLLGHSEDTLGCVSQIHIVPPEDHREGEILTFPDGDAAIPQVPHTYGYYWSEMRTPWGEPFADAFMNEYGVVIASNSCVSTKESKLPHGEGMGYRLRRLVPERCKTAREGVEVAAKLLDTYGYRSTRSYRICDKDEAWMLQVTVGNQYVAQRVGDDEVRYMPNWLTIHKVDFTDTEHKNFYWSENLVKYAIDNGWYTPKTDDYSDFEYCDVYQGDGYFVKSNIDRSDLAWGQLMDGEKVPYRTFSMKAKKKYTPDDVKNILRSHYAGHDEDLKDNPQLSPHRYGICRDSTVEAFVAEFEEEPELTTMWRAFLRSCTNPFMPYFAGITRTPKGFEYMSVNASKASHFSTDASEFNYHPDRPYWAFHTLNCLVEFDYKYCEETVKKGIKEMEDEWKVTVPAIKEAYRKIARTNPEYAKTLITDFVDVQGQKTAEYARQTVLKLINKKDADNMNYWFRLTFGKDRNR